MFEYIVSIGIALIVVGSGSLMLITGIKMFINLLIRSGL